MPRQNPMEAARLATRPVLRRRFYSEAATAAIAACHAVQLDGKPALTPARRLLAAPSLAIAEAIAAEWQAQYEVIDPATMPLTRLANAIIDGVTERPLPVTAEIRQYLKSDLVFYRAGGPPGLVERQARHWDPILAWAEETLGAPFAHAEGISHIAQPGEAIKAAGAAIPDHPWQLGALHAATTLTGSALIALALARGRLSIEAAWQAALVDEDWNMEQWGRDELALTRRAYHFAEFQAAALVLSYIAS